MSPLPAAKAAYEEAQQRYEGILQGALVAGSRWDVPPEVITTEHATRDARDRALRNLLRLYEQALVEREAAEDKPRRGRQIGAATEAGLFALGAYQRTHPRYKPTTNLAGQIKGFADDNRTRGAELLDPDHAFGLLIAAWFEGYRFGGTIPKPKNTG